MEVRYAGNHSYDLFQNLNGNAYINATPPTTTVTAAQNYKTLAQGFPNLFPASTYCTNPAAIGFGTQNCNLTTQSIRANTSFNNYNALQTQLRIQNFHGITANAAYTFSRAINNAERSSVPPAAAVTSQPRKALQYKPCRARRGRKLVPTSFSRRNLRDSRLLRAEGILGRPRWIPVNTI
jgi:hypothetical protein